MNKIDFEELVAYVIGLDESKELVIDGCKLTKIQRQLLTKGITCDFSPGAIDTFAYHFPHNVHVSPFEVTIKSNDEFVNELYRVHSGNKELKITIPRAWKVATK